MNDIKDGFDDDTNEDSWNASMTRDLDASGCIIRNDG